ncbi:copper resistance protein B [Marinovum sp. 2_MG-2023]|uniref:copper resistance protein B n=1 Tax=unclassified Marinovum TaxID=2647166 RepID=UPI0026E19D42|nr:MULTISPECIES: copper resistance protein B [unclassified Marinovum]MDO6732956.1 copper resistance protein B [Marinovum sp. 2_MG-2023]MDO6782223.1 copper resistance protein B [Marinovum sp. 1_MG-2023]
MKNLLLGAAVGPFLALSFASDALAELGVSPTVWGVRTDKLEYRMGEEENAFAWEFAAWVGNDDLRLVWQSEGAKIEGGDVEEMSNQIRLQKPITEFFDGFIGVAASTPEGAPERYYGAFGVTGLASQWFEVEAALYLSEYPYIGAEVEYEGLLTNRLILTPSIEVSLPLADDPDREIAAGGATTELGLRLSYDLIGRNLSPYIGVNYERAFGGTADILRDHGHEVDELTSVVGVNFMF